MLQDDGPVGMSSRQLAIRVTAVCIALFAVVIIFYRGLSAPVVNDQVGVESGLTKASPIALASPTASPHPAVSRQHLKIQSVTATSVEMDYGCQQTWECTLKRRVHQSGAGTDDSWTVLLKSSNGGNGIDAFLIPETDYDYRLEVKLGDGTIEVDTLTIRTAQEQAPGKPMKIDSIVSTGSRYTRVVFDANGIDDSDGRLRQVDIIDCDSQKPVASITDEFARTALGLDTLGRLTDTYIRDLDPGTKYRWGFTITNGVGTSPLSDCFEFQTKPRNQLAIVMLDVPGHKFTREDIDESIADKRAYADFWGYDLHIVNLTQIDAARPPAWGKIKALQLHQDAYEWLYWMDTDTVIMNYTHRVIDVVYDDRGSNLPDLALIQEGTKPPIYYNTGSMLLRVSSQWTKDFLKEVYEAKHVTDLDNPRWEQNEIIAILKENQYWDHVYTSADEDLKRRLNTIVTIMAPYPFASFMAHFAGCQGDSSCTSLFWKYYGGRTPHFTRNLHESKAKYPFTLPR